MWFSNVEYDVKPGLIGNKTLEHNVDVFGFPLLYSYEKNHIVVNIFGNVFGTDKNKKKFWKALLTQNRVVNFEVNNDFFIGTIIESLIYKPLYSSKIIHLSPVHIGNGKEIITIGAYKKEDLISAINSLKSAFDLKINYIKHKQIKTISFFKESPILTDKQRYAMSLALTNGYYNVPRKITLAKLAKLMGCNYSTYQVHLRTAESKIMPFYFENKK